MQYEYTHIGHIRIHENEYANIRVHFHICKCSYFYLFVCWHVLHKCTYKYTYIHVYTLIHAHILAAGHITQLQWCRTAHAELDTYILIYTHVYTNTLAAGHKHATSMMPRSTRSTHLGIPSSSFNFFKLAPRQV